MSKKVALGKGLASLINESPNNLLKASLTETDLPPPEPVAQDPGPLMVEVDSIQPNPHQPRKVFRDKELRELAQSIQANGVIQPLVVSRGEGKNFFLVAGERRLRAAKMAHLTHVPVVLKSVTERDRMVMAIVENIQRRNLNCIEEALALYQLLAGHHLTQEEVAKRLGKERSSIANFSSPFKTSPGGGGVSSEGGVELWPWQGARRGKRRSKGCQGGASRRARAVVCAGVGEMAQEKRGGRKPLPKEDSKDHFEQLRLELEEKTGYHFRLRFNKDGSGEIGIKFTDKDGFNVIYDDLLRR